MLKRGFTLVEWLVHFILLSLMSILVYSLVSDWHKQLYQVHAMLNNALPMHIALDLLHSDLHQANEKNITIDKHTMYMRHPRKTVKWELHAKRLYRTTGSYDKTKKRWHKKVKSLLVSDMQSCDFTMRHHNNKQANQITSVTVSVKHKDKHKAIQSITALRNGRVL